jgi:hypothetical protein
VIPLLSERKSEGGQEEERLSRAVMAYLKKHPQAMDTLDGIAQWWIPEEVRGDLPKLARALEDLIRNGPMECIGSGESARYRLKK